MHLAVGPPLSCRAFTTQTSAPLMARPSEAAAACLDRSPAERLQLLWSRRPLSNWSPRPRRTEFIPFHSGLAPPAGGIDDCRNVPGGCRQPPAWPGPRRFGHRRAPVERNSFRSILSPRNGKVEFTPFRKRSPDRSTGGTEWEWVRLLSAADCGKRKGRASNFGLFGRAWPRAWPGSQETE
jgi:hypothetical protein